MDNLKMAVVGTQFSDDTHSLAWATGRVASEVIAVPEAERSTQLRSAVLAGVVVETADAVTSIATPPPQAYIRLSGAPDDADSPVFNAGTGLWDPTPAGATQPLDPDLTAIAALTSAANKIPYATGAGTWALADLTAYARTLFATASSGAAQTALGISTFIKTLLDDADSATALATLGAAATAHTHSTVRSIEFVIDGGGSAITAGVKGDIEMPYACTITAWRVLADQSGSITVGIWKDTYANFPPTVGDLLVSPALSSAAKAEATGLSLAVAAGDILRFNANATPATVTRVTVSLTITVVD